MKKMFFLAAAVWSVLPAAAQQGQGGELSVEDYYLKESVQIEIIREQAASEDREGKLLALDYIRDSLENGDKNDDIRRVLEDIGLEGTVNKTRSEGRVANNFADVRMRAVAYLGDVGTKAAADSIVKIIRAEDEPAVVTEGFRALAKIGSNEGGKAMDTINWMFNQFNTVNPDNRLAFSYLDALDSLLPKMPRNTADEKRIYNDALDKIRSIINNYKYITPVRAKAKSVLTSISTKGK